MFVLHGMILSESARRLHDVGIIWGHDRIKSALLLAAQTSRACAHVSQALQCPNLRPLGILRVTGRRWIGKVSGLTRSWLFIARWLLRLSSSHENFCLHAIHSCLIWGRSAPGTGEQAQGGDMWCARHRKPGDVDMRNRLCQFGLPPSIAEAPSRTFAGMPSTAPLQRKRSLRHSILLPACCRQDFCPSMWW